MPLAVAVGSGAAAALHWVHADHMGVPLVTTSAAGAVVTPTGYALSGFPGQFANAVLLPGAAHHYNRYRDYDPTTGRYIQADPIGLEGDPNPYAYALGNPLRYTDPSGEFVPIAVGFLVGAGIEYLTNDCATPRDMIIGGALGTLGAGRLLYAGVAKVGARLATDGVAAHAFRNSLKRFARGPLAGSNYRIRPYENMLEKYGSDAAVKAAAGRTNPMANAFGGFGAGFGASTAANCQCSR
jgi:RHS repeat-associated protein